MAAMGRKSVRKLEIWVGRKSVRKLEVWVRRKDSLLISQDNKTGFLLSNSSRT